MFQLVITNQFIKFIDQNKINLSVKNKKILSKISSKKFVKLKNFKYFLEIKLKIINKASLLKN